LLSSHFLSSVLSLPPSPSFHSQTSGYKQHCLSHGEATKPPEDRVLVTQYPH
jgi:hypothetical protein